MKARGQQQRQAKRIAEDRIRHLFETAERHATTDPALSDRCIGVARAIAMRQRLRLDREQRRAFCHACHAYFGPGRRRVRTRDGHVVVTCLACGARARYGMEPHERRKPDAGPEADLLDRQAGRHRRDDR